MSSVDNGDVLCYNIGMNKHIVYWVHYQYQTDIRNEGYVGVTKRSILQRKYAHHHNKKSSISDIAYDDNLIWDVVHQNLSQHEAFIIEEFYRPVENIGMNKNKGGSNSGCNHKNRTSYTRTVVKPYKTQSVFIDDMEFCSQKLARQWLVNNNICSDRTAQRRLLRRNHITLEECRVNGN